MIGIDQANKHRSAAAQLRDAADKHEAAAGALDLGQAPLVPGLQDTAKRATKAAVEAAAQACGGPATPAPIQTYQPDPS
jgi:hypothetical protein